MKTLKIGVVGLGHRGRAMITLASSFDFVQVKAACDIFPHNWYEKQWLSDMSMAEMFPNASFYESYEHMLDEEELDVMIVETGADIHAAFCAKALEHNIHVLTDIPVVANLQEAEMLWQASLKSKAQIYTGANPNYQKFTYLLNEFYEKGLLGKPYCMEAEYIHWFTAEEDIHLNENGAWRKLLVPIRYCTHSLGPLLTILSEDLKTVSCFGTGHHAGDIQDPPPGTDDMMCANFKTESGVVVRLMRNNRCRAAIGHHNYRVFGTEGYMERIDRCEKPVIRYNSMKEADTSLQEIGGEFMPPAYADNPKALGHGGMDYAMLDNFFLALTEGKGRPVTLKEGLAMTLPGIYAEESARRGGEVLTIRYPWESDWTAEF